MELTQLHFSIPRYGGCAKVDGIVTASAEHLMLEYRTSDNMLGMWSSGITRLSIAYRDLQQAEYRGGFFSPSLVLTARALETFGDFPTSAPAQITLCAPWKHRASVRALASEIALALTYQAADRFRRGLEGPPQLPA